MDKVKLTPAVDEKISDIARRTAKIGSLVVASQGGKVVDETVTITPQTPQQQLAERFELSDLMQYWNPKWKLERAGFGGDNLGAMPGIRGITYVDGDTLVTFPRDEVRALRMIRTLQLGAQPKLSCRVGVGNHRTWELLVYVGNKHIRRQIMTGEAAERNWSDIALDLSEYANKNVTIRLYQKTLFQKQPLPSRKCVLAEDCIRMKIQPNARAGCLGYGFFAINVLRYASGVNPVVSRNRLVK